MRPVTEKRAIHVIGIPHASEKYHPTTKPPFDCCMISFGLFHHPHAKLGSNIVSVVPSKLRRAIPLLDKPHTVVNCHHNTTHPLASIKDINAPYGLSTGLKLTSKAQSAKSFVLSVNEYPNVIREPSEGLTVNCHVLPTSIPVYTVVYASLRSVPPVFINI